MEKNILSSDSYQSGEKIYGVVNIPHAHYSKDLAVVFLSGFERFGYEQKRRLLQQELAQKNILTLQFDFTGLGLSGGVFNNPTIENLLTDTKNIISDCLNVFSLNNVCLVGHSLGSCVAVEMQKEPYVDKLVLLAPALNQKELNRYWYTLNNNKDLKISYEDYKQYFDEEAYQQWIQLPSTKKANIISPDYMREMSQRDFSEDVINSNNILHIHGDKDMVVPLSSLNHAFMHQHIVEGGDHDLEKPGIPEKRVKVAADFCHE